MNQRFQHNRPMMPCRLCKKKGHHINECLQRKYVKDFSLHVSHKTSAIVGSGKRCFRQHGLDHMLTSLEDSRPARFDDVTIRTERTSVHIHYDQCQNINLAIQAMDHDAETMIRIQPTRVTISGKYTIYNGQLQEDVYSNSTGGKQQSSPAAHIHILLKIQTFDRETMCVRVNGESYYMFWRPVHHGRFIRKAVTVYTEHGYIAMQAWTGYAVSSLNEYFIGTEIKQETSESENDDDTDYSEAESMAPSKKWPKRTARNNENIGRTVEWPAQIQKKRNIRSHEQCQQTTLELKKPSSTSPRKKIVPREILRRFSPGRNFKRK